MTMTDVRILNPQLLTDEPLLISEQYGKRNLSAWHVISNTWHMRCLSSNSSETLALILNDQIYRQVAYYEAWHLIITSNPWKDATSISTGTMYLVLLW